MFGIGEDKDNKKIKKPENVFRKCKTTGYKEVYYDYLLDVDQEMKVKTTLKDSSPTSLSQSSSSSVQMLEHLMCWMFMRQKPFWISGEKQDQWKKWIALKEDHWIVNNEVRSQLIKEKVI